VRVAKLDESLAGLTGQAADQPIYAQSVPNGERRRIYVAGKRAIATGIPGASGTSGPEARPERAALEPVVANAACKLATELDLRFAAIDLVSTDDEQHYCLEVNEFPIYNHCTEEVQAEITSAMVEDLSATEEVAA
jgi:glutathione synthase/RimK-type ligase-like ATP-grasp enzyme